MIVNLEEVNPKGRLDVLLYRGLQGLVEKAEQDRGIQGIWDNAKPLVQNIITEHISGIELPSEVKMLLGIVQANLK